MWQSTFTYGNSEQLDGFRIIGDEPGTPGQVACVQVPVLSLNRHDLEQVILLLSVLVFLKSMKWA